jgi:hypothetical protein
VPQVIAKTSCDDDFTESQVVEMLEVEKKCMTGSPPAPIGNGSIGL